MPKIEPNLAASFKALIRNNCDDDGKLSGFLSAQPQVFYHLNISDFKINIKSPAAVKIFVKNICHVLDHSPKAFEHIFELLNDDSDSEYSDSYSESESESEPESESITLLKKLTLDRMTALLPQYCSAIRNGENDWKQKLSLLGKFSIVFPEISDVYKSCEKDHVARLLRLLNDELLDDKYFVLNELYSYRTAFPEIDKNVSDYFMKKFTRMKSKSPNDLKLINNVGGYSGYYEAQFVLGEYYYERKEYKAAEMHFTNAKNYIRDAHAYLGHIMEMGKSKDKKDLCRALESYFQAMPHPLAEERLRALSTVSSKKQVNVKCLALLYLGLSLPDQSGSFFEQAYVVDSATYISFVSDKMPSLDNLEIFSKLRLLRHAVASKDSGDVRFSKQLFATLFNWLKNPGSQSANELSVKLKDYLSENLYAKFSLILSDHFELPVDLRVAVLEQAQTYSPKHMREEVTKVLVRYRPDILPSSSGASSQVGMFATPPAVVSHKKRSDKASASASQSRGC